MGVEMFNNNHFSRNVCKTAVKIYRQLNEIFEIIRFRKYRSIEIETNLYFKFTF